MGTASRLAGKEAGERNPVLAFITYPPVLRGLILLVISGFTFPLGGVFILRMNALPLRYLLMHGVLLGGALGLALQVNATFMILAVNLLLVILLNISSSKLKADYGHMTMFFMVAAIAGASIITTLFHVPAKDTLTLLWGSLYASLTSSVIIAGIIGLGLAAFSIRYFKSLTAIFYDKEVALSLGIQVRKLELVIMVMISLVIAVAMQLMGALLLDAQLILPVVIAGTFASGLRAAMFYSCLLGGLFSISGFFISLALDIPISAGVAIPAVVTFLILILRKGVMKK